jgi:hypothetical protein
VQIGREKAKCQEPSASDVRRFITETRSQSATVVLGMGGQIAPVFRARVGVVGRMARRFFISPSGELT